MAGPFPGHIVEEAFTINASEVPSTQTDFPVFIRFQDLASDFRCTQPFFYDEVGESRWREEQGQQEDTNEPEPAVYCSADAVSWRNTGIDNKDITA